VLVQSVKFRLKLKMVVYMVNIFAEQDKLKIQKVKNSKINRNSKISFTKAYYRQLQRESSKSKTKTERKTRKAKPLDVKIQKALENW
jgi:hypothetical protein